jgi:hemoglobin-like flavoprotein
MTPRQIALVQETFEQVAPVADVAATLFYARLFDLDPSLRPMFAPDLDEQKRKLMQTIGVAVRGLGDITSLLTAVRALGARHAGYGVIDAHYATVGAALIWTLGHALDEAFTDEVRDAWIAVYTLLADTMKAGAAGAPLLRSA